MSKNARSPGTSANDATQGEGAGDLTANLGGDLTPPLANGELIFEAPWEGRVFAMARALSEAGHYTWDDFRAALIKSISNWEASCEPGAQYRYYDCFLDALESLLIERGLIEGNGLGLRVSELAARPHGHDHHHGH